MWRIVHLNRDFPLGSDVPQWYGDTTGFWDGDALITWTANIQGWNQHSSWEWSDKLETIEILTPARDTAGKFIGIDWETIIYDSEALAQPVRILWHRNYQQSWTAAGRVGWTECTRPLRCARAEDTQVYIIRNWTNPLSREGEETDRLVACTERRNPALDLL
jgi:hypothetical protein